ILNFENFYENLAEKIPIYLINETWFLENLAKIKKNFYQFFKRLIDIVLALILFVPFSLLLAPIALAIKLDSRGPIFYRQKRVGKEGKEFWLLKFRSMKEGAEKISGLKSDGKDERLTRLGSFLRKSYLDELPQIINILKGKMSFVGPRPERPEYVKALKEKIPFYEMRLLVLPGISGWAQLKMEKDASVEDAPEKLQYDLYYIKNRSLILDLAIAVKTIMILLGRKGR
ncbi:MAG: sugar transferase, partial [Minisyncoccales bacterium]